jgi:hypothetical protein
VFHNPAGAFAREMAKHEMGWSVYGPPGRPREQQGPQPYPCQMYLVKRAETGGGVVVVHSARAESEAERRNYESRGYENGLQAAAEALAAAEQAQAKGAAERAFADRRMSDTAKAEVAAYEDSISAHVAVIPETPIKRRGRPRKVTTESA